MATEGERTGAPETGEQGQRTRSRLPTTVLLTLLTLGTFAVGTASFIVAGMLLPIAPDLSVSVGAAGQLATGFAITYAVAAPTMAVLLAKGDRRRVLAVGAVVFALGVALQVVVMVPAQVLAGAGAALYVSNATATAGALVPEERRGRALALVYSGFTGATLVGGPLGLVAAEAVGWRGVLAAVAAAAAAGPGHCPQCTCHRRPVPNTWACSPGGRSSSPSSSRRSPKPP